MWNYALTLNRGSAFRGRVAPQRCPVARLLAEDDPDCSAPQLAQISTSGIRSTRTGSLRWIGRFGLREAHPMNFSSYIDHRNATLQLALFPYAACWLAREFHHRSSSGITSTRATEAVSVVIIAA